MAEGGGEERATGADIGTHDVFISYAPRMQPLPSLWSSP